MRRLLAPLLIATSAAAAPHGPGCQLSTTECIQVAREIAAEQVLYAADEQTYGLDLPALPRTRALIHRQTERIQARLSHLSPRIGQEWVRIEFCNAQAEGLRLGTVSDLDPRCR